ncbi:POT family domain-containing protein [Ditylenchus destructor]|uniref:POT family domain-containing protein n=1 Tax=Ditylenchus destructor TaxID=166010 RepID=A0AAD4MXP3_9BILA|nr:POT family domain-containing protein [Ditylenchus destructor]
MINRYAMIYGDCQVAIILTGPPAIASRSLSPYSTDHPLRQSPLLDTLLPQNTLHQEKNQAKSASKFSNGPGKPALASEEEDTMGNEKGSGLISSMRRYPSGVFFMLGNEFCERFSFYGMRAILLLYLMEEHDFSESHATFFYHLFICLAYFSPLFGSIAADNYFGRFRVILWVSLIYVFGHILLSAGAIPYLPYTSRSILDFGGLIVIAVATGGIKPCVSAFAADQFDESMQQERTQFFSFFYFAINAGSLLAIAITPILRGRVSCFGKKYCFPLAFGVPGVLMFFAFILFLCGWRFYKITPAGKGNVIGKVVRCAFSGIRGKANAMFRKQDTADHWLEYSSPKYSSDRNLIAGVKSLVSVSILFIPIVFFWALFDQQGSTWVLQARRMDGRVGPITILPDQMNTFNPLIIIIMVPIFEAFLYPALKKVVNVTPLRKMAAGGILAALAFIMAGLLQLKVNETLEPKPESGNVFLRRVGNSTADFWIDNYGPLTANNKTELAAGTYNMMSDQESHLLELNGAHQAYVVGIFDRPDGGNHSIVLFPYSCEKSKNGMTTVYLMLEGNSSLNNQNIYIFDKNNKVVNTEVDHKSQKDETIIFPGNSIDIKPGFISYPEYTIAYGDCRKSNSSDGPPYQCKHTQQFDAEMGAAHVLTLTEVDSDKTAFENLNVVRPNSVSILWQLPQFFVITIGEILFSVTGLEFSYSQAAPTMKSVLQAFWLLTTFFGNLIDMGISGTHVIKEPAMEFFFYAVLMIVVISVFIAIAMNYKYVDDPPMTLPPLSSVSPSEKDSKC